MGWLDKFENWVSRLEKKVDKFEGKVTQLEGRMDEIDSKIDAGDYDPNPDKPLKWWQAVLILVVNFTVVGSVAYIASWLFSSILAATVFIVSIIGIWLLVGLGMLFSPFYSYRITGCLLLVSNGLILYFKVYL